MCHKSLPGCPPAFFLFFPTTISEFISELLDIIWSIHYNDDFEILITLISDALDAPYQVRDRRIINSNNDINHINLHIHKAD